MDRLEDLIARASGGGLSPQIELREEIGRLLISESEGQAKVEAVLRTAPPASWIALDAAMRAEWYGLPQPPTSSISPGAPVLTGIASMARDGHLRERAVSQLAGERSPLVGPFLALRTVDWVAEVARLASAILATRLGIDRELLALTAPLIFALEDRLRRSWLDAEVLRSTATDQSARNTLLASPDVKTRRRTIGHEPTRNALSTDELISLATTDGDTVVAATAGSAAVDRLAGKATASLGPLLSAPASVRAAVLNALRPGDQSEEAARRHLFDRSPTVRGAAQQAHRRFGGDPAVLYRQAILASEHVPISILELAHVGTSSDYQTVIGALKSPDPSTRRAAVNAARWVAGDQLQDLLTPMLWDPSAGVTRAVERRLRARASDLDEAALRKLIRAQRSHNRRTAFRLLRRRNVTDRLEANFLALADTDSALRRDAQLDLRAWLNQGAARAPRADLATRRRLADELDAVSSQLLANEVELIEFHAGLRQGDL